MKAIVDKKNWKITLDNEAVKAIRFCYGVNTNLRISLKNINREHLWYWIRENKYRLFGSGMADLLPIADENWSKYESMIDDVIAQIVR